MRLVTRKICQTSAARLMGPDPNQYELHLDITLGPSSRPKGGASGPNGVLSQSETGGNVSKKRGKSPSRETGVVPNRDSNLTIEPVKEPPWRKREAAGDEEVERLAARQSILGALERLSELDRETAERIAEEAVAYFEAQHAEFRLLDLEYRLGLTSEEVLLRAYEDVAYLDASVLLGGTAFTAGAAKLGINLTRLRPAAALNALRSGRARLDNMINTRRREVDVLVANRFAQLGAQGHGPQRHEGAVTPQMLEDRVLRGFDPMTGSRTDRVTGAFTLQIAEQPE